MRHFREKIAQHAIKRPFWAILPTLGEYFRAIAIDSRRWANFVAPMLLTAPQDETVSTIAGASVRLHETHDAFARQNCAENRCIWLAMVSSVSPKTKHTPAKVLTVSRESSAAPVGGGGAWPGFEPTRRATHQQPSATGVEGAGGHRRDRRARLRCPWAAAEPASKKSHAIRLDEASTKLENVAIPTI